MSKKGKEGPVPSAPRASFQGVLNVVEGRPMPYSIELSYPPSVLTLRVSLDESMTQTYAAAYDLQANQSAGWIQPMEGLFAEDVLARSLHACFSGQSSDLQLVVKFVEEPVDDLASRPNDWHDMPIIGDHLALFVSATPDARARSHPDYRATLVLPELVTPPAAVAATSPSASGKHASSTNSQHAFAAGAGGAGVPAVSRAEVVRSMRGFRAVDDALNLYSHEIAADTADLKAIVRRQQLALMKLTATVESLQEKVEAITPLSVSFAPKGLFRVPCGSYSKTLWTWRCKPTTASNNQNNVSQNGSEQANASMRQTEEDEDSRDALSEATDDLHESQAEGVGVHPMGLYPEHANEDGVDLGDLRGELGNTHSLRPFVELDEAGAYVTVHKSGRYLVNASLRFVDVSESVFLAVDGRRRFKHGGGEYAWSNFHLTIHFNQVLDLKAGETLSFETDASVDKWHPEDWTYANVLFLTRIGPL
jgi:hypothetical protein